MASRSIPIHVTHVYRRRIRWITYSLNAHIRGKYGSRCYAVLLNIQEPDLDANLERWWTEARKRVRKLDRKRFDSMIIITAWILWKQRNSRVFGNVREQKDPTHILEAIKEEFLMWELARRGGSSQIARE
jgi:hypothetical protein